MNEEITTSVSTDTVTEQTDEYIGDVTTATTVSYEDLLAELEQIKENQTATVEVLTEINEQQLQTSTATVYILAVLILWGVFSLVKSALNNCF